MSDPRSTQPRTGEPAPDLVCLSHLRWGFVYQRPQHLLTRFARDRRVFYVEEPVFEPGPPRLEVDEPHRNLWTVVPHMPQILSEEQNEIIADLLIPFFADRAIERYVLWYYTPMAVAFTRHLRAAATVWDCMDELGAFAWAPRSLRDREGELLDSADLVFTGGQSLYEAKTGRHPHVHLFPSSVDRAHFGAARSDVEEPADQRDIPHPRLGYFGVIDERMDLDLLRGVAERRPDWHLVMVGPILKIDPADLPRLPNIHYLGQKRYEELPSYAAGWDLGTLPFARNESTRFISPTKTPEYLAAGLPVVSTSIRDVVRPYGDEGLAGIADTPEDFVLSAEAMMAEDPQARLAKADGFLSSMSWDATFARMSDLVEDAIAARARAHDDRNDLVDLTDARSALRGGSPRLDFDYLVVGAGFAGSVLAERLARVADKRVLVVEQRDHIAGNAYDHHNDAGILVHRYGPHIFHTNSREVFEYLSRFTEWRQYEHRVLASVDGHLVPLPINLDTINELYGTSMDARELERFFHELAEPVEHARTSEDVVVGKVGRELYEKFFRNYTRKQWDLDPSELDASVTSRVPVRTNRDPRYFTDTYQAMPKHGYTRMFERMLDHPNIKVMLNTTYREAAELARYGETIFTGPIDEFFDYRFGKLPYRSLEFRFETHEQEWYQQAPVVNYPNEHLYTRCTEFKYLTGQRHHSTTVVYEYPRAEGDPYYPVPRPENAALFKRYRELARQTAGAHFVGRLATYKYYNMDQVVAQALAVFNRLLGGAPRSIGKEDDVLGATISSPRAVGRSGVRPHPGGHPLVRPTGT